MKVIIEGIAYRYDEAQGKGVYEHRAEEHVYEGFPILRQAGQASIEPSALVSLLEASGLGSFTGFHIE